MAQLVGRSRPLSLARRNVCDFLHASMKIPTVTIGRTVDLRAVAIARQAASPRPSWCGIFTKAYAIVASRRVELRRACLEFPWGRLYDHPHNIASVVAESTIDGEAVLVPILINNPESLSLLALDERLTRAKNNPQKEVKTFRRSLILARLPRMFRRFMWWYGLNVSGYRRARLFGTFGVTTVSGLGADSLRPLSPWTTLLHYGVIDAECKMVARMTYDHRVLDGTIPALALRDFEGVLHKEILGELQTMQGRAAA